MQIRKMNIGDYENIIDLLSNTMGVTIREADSQENIQNYLERNPKLNFVAHEDTKIIGCVMCGHDGRRGYLQHLVVHPKFQNKGIGYKLFMSCIKSLENIGIQKSHIFVFKTNELANKFWNKRGWILREDLNMYSFNISSNANI